MFFSFFLSFFLYCSNPLQGLRAGGLRLIATVQMCNEKKNRKDDKVKKTVRELKTGLKLTLYEECLTLLLTEMEVNPMFAKHSVY